VILVPIKPSGLPYGIELTRSVLSSPRGHREPPLGKIGIEPPVFLGTTSARTSAIIRFHLTAYDFLLPATDCLKVLISGMATFRPPGHFRMDDLATTAAHPRSVSSHHASDFVQTAKTSQI